MYRDKSISLQGAHEINLRKKFIESDYRKRQGIDYILSAGQPLLEPSPFSTQTTYKSATSYDEQKALSSGDSYKSTCVLHEKPVVSAAITYQKCYDVYEGSSESDDIRSVLEQVDSRIADQLLGQSESCKKSSPVTSCMSCRDTGTSNPKATALEERRNMCNFLDTLLIDMEAFEKTHMEMHPKVHDHGNLPQYQSFPVVIDDITELGPSSVLIEYDTYEKDFVDHLELEVDGTLMPYRLSPQRHSWVIFDIDVTEQHMFCLMAMPKSDIQRYVDKECDYLMEKYGVPRKKRFHKEFEEADDYLAFIETWNSSQFLYNPHGTHKT